MSEDDGKIYTGETLSTETGVILSFPAGKGRLEVVPSDQGPLKVWFAKPENMRAAFVQRDVWAKSSALPPDGGTLETAAQSWSFSTDREAVICIRADSGGVTALLDSAGKTLALAAGATERIVVSSAPKGYYSAYTRPLKGAAQSGTLKLRVLSPIQLEADGEGAAKLIGPGDMILYRFEVKAPGRIGAGVRAERDGLTAWLYDSAFKRLDTGALFIRSLEPGVYYMLVESGSGTQKFAPVVFGLGGSRTETPDDVVRSYRED
jgi:hypothetical protein